MLCRLASFSQSLCSFICVVCGHILEKEKGNKEMKEGRRENLVEMAVLSENSYYLYYFPPAL